MTALRRLALVVVGVGAWLSAAPAFAASGTVEKVFAPGQKVWMDLRAGGYTIQAGRDDRIVVRWDVPSGDEHEVRVDVAVRGAEATVTSTGPSNNFRVNIELPARSDLTVRLTAGDLRIRGIQGSKDVHQWAGEIDIEVGRPEDYRSVEAGVTAGDLSARPFEVSKGGLFRSFRWHGPGKYDLKVSLTAGDLKLRN